MTQTFKQLLEIVDLGASDAFYKSRNRLIGNKCRIVKWATKGRLKDKSEGSGWYRSVNVVFATDVEAMGIKKDGTLFFLRIRLKKR